MSTTADIAAFGKTADPEVFALTLRELAAGGEAVGKLPDGRAVFVPGGAPDEAVDIVLTQTHRSYARAELVRVRSKGPQRVVPACSLCSGRVDEQSLTPPADAACGGCPLMHIARPAQLQAKAEWVRRALRHTGAEILPIVAPTPELGYRVRARLLVRNGLLSFASARSHRGVRISHCPVLDPTLEAVLLGEGPDIAAALGEGGTLAGLVGSAGAAQDRAVHLAVQLAPGGQAGEVRDWLNRLVGSGHIAGATLLTTAYATTPEVFGAPGIALGRSPDLGPLWASADGFAQASAAGHDVLPAIVRELLGAPASGGRWPRLLELYAGSGNLTRALLPAAEELLAIEGDAAAVARLQRLCQGRSEDHARIAILHQPVERALAAQVRSGARFDAAVLDPPRTGARAALPFLARLGVRRVVYVSCDAMTLGRDLVELRAAGLRPRCIQPLDLVPHTAQLECVAVLAAD